MELLLDSAFDGFEVFAESQYPLPNKNPPSNSWVYAPLYKENRVWQIGFDASCGQIMTVYGVRGGKMQVSRINVDPKRKNSVETQSVIEVNSRVNERLKKDRFSFGSSPLSCKESADGKWVPEVLSAPKPQAMLAQEYFSVKKRPEFPLAMQPKLDGVRCMIDLHLETKETGEKFETVRLSTRQGNDFMHLSTLIGDEAREILKRMPRGAVLDGELMIPRGEGGDSDFSLTVSAVKTRIASKKAAPAFEAAKQRLKMYVFNAYFPLEPKMPFIERARLLADVFDAASDSLQKLLLVPHRIVQCEDDLMAAHAHYTSGGYEGSMILLPNGEYEPGKRSAKLLKLKNFHECEGEVIGVVPGRGKEADAAQLTVRVGADGSVPAQQTTLHANFPLARRREWFANPALIIGRLVTIKYQGLTDSGALRFAQVKEVRDYE